MAWAANSVASGAGSGPSAGAAATESAALAASGDDGDVGDAWNSDGAGEAPGLAAAWVAGDAPLAPGAAPGPSSAAVPDSDGVWGSTGKAAGDELATAAATDVSALGVEAPAVGVIVAGIIAGVAVAAIWAWRADDRPTSVAARRGLAGFVAAGALLVSPETGDVSGGEAGGAIAWLAGAAAAKAVATAAGCDATGCAPAGLCRRGAVAGLERSDADGAA